MSTDTPQSPPQHHFQHDPERTELEKVLSSGWSKLEPYYNIIVFGGLAAAIVIGVGVYLSKQSRVVSTEGWADFASYQAPSDFKALAEKHPAAPVANWALLEAGRRYTNEGIRTSLTNRTASDESLSEGRAAFKAILDKTEAVPPEIREEALFGLANCLEALSGENIDEAISAYKALISQFPETRHKRWADARIAALESPATADFYTWFRQQNPSPQDRALPSDLLPFDHPPLPAPTGTPGAEAPTGTAAPFPTGETPAAPPGEPAKEMPAPEAGTPAAEPAAEKPAEPASEPAAEKPAETPAEPAAETPTEPAEEPTATSEETPAAPAAE